MSDKEGKESSEVSTGLKTIDQFITISKDIAKLPALLMADSKGCAADFVEICKALLDGNENVVRWFHKFLYFDFTEPDARKKFIALKTDYEALKTGSGYQKLKFDCSRIRGIYHTRISSKLGVWFQKKKLSQAQQVFEQLTHADAQMVRFVFTDVFGRLSDFANRAEKCAIEKQDLSEAETLRLDFKVKTKDLVPRLQMFSDELAELVLSFSEKAGARQK
jgi:hypothetical protein